MNFEDLLDFCRADGRVCPEPTAWNRLWEMLPGRSREGWGWVPAAPLILSGWSASTNDQKRERFAEHLAWARDHGALAGVSAMILALPDSGWHREERPWGG